MNQEENLKRLYSNRFDHKPQEMKSALWRVLIEEFLQKHIDPYSVVLDILIPSFLPFTTQGRRSSTKLLRLYLKLPFLWRFFGKQMFVKASKDI